MKPPFRESVIRVLGFALLSYFLNPLAFAAGVTIRFLGEPEGFSEVRPWIQEVTEEWAKKTGNKLEYIGRPNDNSAALQQFEQAWVAKSPDVDIYQIDVVGRGLRPRMRLI
jgi:trehalose/maltose transport system substrate-binding protein